MSVYVVWGRTMKRGGTRTDRKWSVAIGGQSFQQAHIRARQMISGTYPGWNYTIVRLEGERPGARDQEDYCRWAT